MMGSGQTLQYCWNRCENLQICCIVSVADDSSEDKVESNVATVNVISSEFSWRARCCAHGQTVLPASSLYLSLSHLLTHSLALSLSVSLSL